MTNDPSQRLDTVWQTFHQASAQRTGFTLATLATVTPDGHPRARSVIMREFATNPARIFFATDVRSPKVAEIHANPQVALVLYDEASAVQCRAGGTATLITDDATRDRAWRNLASHTRQSFASSAVPGMPLKTMDESDGRTPFERFGWISIELQSLDWLELSTEPHRRWQFQRRGTSWTGQPVTP